MFRVRPGGDGSDGGGGEAENEPPIDVHSDFTLLYFTACTGL
jgi:hypothetical protein